MNLRKWMKKSRHFSAMYIVPIFGKKQNGSMQYGTGFLLLFRGTPMVLTCAHVLEPIRENIYMSTINGGKAINYPSRCIKLVKSLDLGLIIFPSPIDLGVKSLYCSSSAILQNIDVGEAVFMSGFPGGHHDLQSGIQVNHTKEQVEFTSLTYLSVTESLCLNSRIKIKQPTIRWVPDETYDFKRFNKLTTYTDNFEMRGLSGSPIFEASSRKLIGYATAIDERQRRRIYYMPIDSAFRKIDTML